MKKTTISNAVRLNMADEHIQKKSRKPPLLLKQEELLAKEVKNISAYTIKQTSYSPSFFSFLKDRSNPESPFLAQFI